MIVFETLLEYQRIAKDNDIITFEFFSHFYRYPDKLCTFKVVDAAAFKFRGYCKKISYTTVQDQKVILWTKDEFKNMQK